MDSSSSTPTVALALEEALRKLDNTVRDESARRLKLQILLLQNENDTLQSRLDDAIINNTEQQQWLEQAEQKRVALSKGVDEYNCMIEQLKQQLSQERNPAKSSSAAHDDLKQQLSDAHATLIAERKSAQTELDGLRKNEMKSRADLENLRLQLQTIEVDGKKGRKTGAIQKTEIDHLKVQISTQEQLLKDCRQALSTEEQKVGIIQAEFDSQRESCESRGAQIQLLQSEITSLKKQLKESQAALSQQKVLTKSNATTKSQDADVDNQISQLQEKLETAQDELKDLQNELTNELGETDQVRKELQKIQRAAKSREAELESKVDLLKAKLQSTKEQLMETRTELAQARQAAITKSVKVKVPAEQRKKSFREMRVDQTIGTPDGVAARGKKQTMREHTSVGEKSMFSITPFLNRTANIPMDSPQGALGDEQNGAAVQSIESPVPTKKSLEVSTTQLDQINKDSVSEARPTTAPESSDILQELKAGTQNKKPTQKPMKRKPKMMSSLGNVVEEEDENEPPRDQPPNVSAKQLVVKKQSLAIVEEIEEAETKKVKKRKLLGAGKTLFDDEEGEGVKRTAQKIASGPARALGKGGLGMKASLKPGLAASGAFGTFSPLKKDRRGVNASFLG